MAKGLPKYFHCNTEFTLTVLGGKWKTVILCFLKERPHRYSELRAVLPSLSEKVLTERLKELIAKELVAQRKSGSSSTYVLTAKGRSLTKPLQALYDWGSDHAREYGVKIGEPAKGARSRKAGG